MEKTTKEVLQPFKTLEVWEDSKGEDYFYSLKAYTERGYETIVRTPTPLKRDKEHLELICKAVNERQKLLDSNRFGGSSKCNGEDGKSERNFKKKFRIELGNVRYI
jgi:hypothetical protein